VIDISTPRQQQSYRPRTGILFVVVIACHLILISAQVQSKSGVPILQGLTFGLFSRVENAVASVAGGVTGTWKNYFALRGVQAENEALRKQLADLEVTLQQQRAQAERADSLQELLALKKATPLPTLAAEVIARNPNPVLLTVTVNRGRQDGVTADMAVITPKGVVGRVIGPVASHAARVQLIVDRNAALGAIAERSRAGGMAAGADGDPPLKMDLVSNLADIKQGDLVVASGVDGIYPRGFAIGTVESSERGKALYRTITVRPAVDFSNLDTVLIVLVPARGATPEDPPAPREGAK
jgi:rod shape-determining protein MreC